MYEELKRDTRKEVYAVRKLFIGANFYVDQIDHGVLDY